MKYECDCGYGTNSWWMYMQHKSWCRGFIQFIRDLR